MKLDAIATYGFLTTSLGTVLGVALALASGNQESWALFAGAGGAVASLAGWYFCVHRHLRRVSTPMSKRALKSSAIA
jgi:hypothetical protein